MKLSEIKSEDFYWHGTTVGRAKKILAGGGTIQASEETWETGNQAPVPGHVYLSLDERDAAHYAMKRGGKAKFGVILAIPNSEVDESLCLPDEDEICDILVDVWKAQECPWKIKHIISPENLALGDKIVAALESAAEKGTDTSLSYQWDDILGCGMDPESQEAEFYDLASPLAQQIPGFLKEHEPALYEEINAQTLRVRVPSAVHAVHAWKIPISNGFDGPWRTEAVEIPFRAAAEKKAVAGGLPASPEIPMDRDGGQSLTK